MPPLPQESDGVRRAWSPASPVLHNLERVAGLMTAAHERRDELIRAAAALGASSREIAQATGLTPTRVGQIRHAQHDAFAGLPIYHHQETT
jgi:hypothetical protein